MLREDRSPGCCADGVTSERRSGVAMTTEIQTVAMTDPQLTNNNNNNNNSNHNNNNDGEPKYLHKKFKKMATTESAPVEKKQETTAVSTGPSAELPKKRDVDKDPKDVSKDVKESSKSEASPESEGEPAEARKTGYVCPYCKLSCAKPSVLQKHIRAHTNERPYPCVPCGFAFKTKSNLYKHCRSRAHALKMEGGDASKVSEDSDISLSDSASNGTGTPPPPPAVSTPNSQPSTKTVKTGKIYKPKFHTALQCVNNETESSPVTSSTPIPTNVTTATNATTTTTTTTPSTTSKPNAEQLQEHIDKIITDNRAIVEAVDPRLHKLMQRQQSLVEPKHVEQPLNLSSAEESSSRKRCYSESFAHENRGRVENPEGSIIKDLLLKTRANNTDETSTFVDNENFICPCCKIVYTNADNLEAHRRYYCKGSSMSPRRGEFQLDLDKRDDYDVAKSSDYYGTIQPLPSPGPLLGNTRLVDAYAPPTKKQRSESVPTTLRSLEELSKYPRPNSLQMFGGEVRILDNTGETKTMRIEPRQTNSPSNEHVTNNKCVTTETSSIVVRSGLHSGGTMVHKPPGGIPSTTSNNPNSSISLPNNTKILAPIVPNISTPNLAPTMTCYNYLEPHLNPLTNITAYNPLTLQQAGIASILHGGKVIPYVPGMPGPQTLAVSGNADISPANLTTMDSANSSYKVIPGLPGLHMISQPLDLASPVRVQTPSVPGIPGPNSNNVSYIGPNLSQPLDLANPAREICKLSFKTPLSGETLRQGSITSPKVPNAKIVGESTNLPSIDKYRLVRSSPPTPTSELIKSESDRHIKNNVSTVKYKLGVEITRENKEFNHHHEKISKVDGIVNYSNGIQASEISVSVNSYGKRFSPKTLTEIGCRKRPANWNINEIEVPRINVDNVRESPVMRYEISSPSPTFNNSSENLRINVNTSTDPKSLHVDNWTANGINGGGKLRNHDQPPLVIVVNSDTSKTNVPNVTSMELVNFKIDKSEVKIPKSTEIEVTNENEEEEMNPKFLRPTSLPLKPGTFTPKRHHGITPTANTLPLISPETPRPKKSYGQLYLNGHAYTYLGLKCSTRVFYCTLNRPQPMYVTQQHGLSMYSNWKICKESPPDLDMAHYDSRHRPLSYTVAWKKQDDILTHSSQRPSTPTSPDSGLESDTQEKTRRVKIFDGGFESNEDYTYVRGRGRGRYVCEECGIRCKKPSMLKKHIRTHTDVRPYTCKHCTFSFKTKGNLTKHMKSKAHYKKCVELGVMPVPTSVCDENIDKEAIARLVAGGGNADDSTDEDDDTEGEDSDESGSEEQEAAQSLLSLSQPSSNRLPGLLPAGRPTTYPYVLSFPTSCSVSTTNSVVTTCTTTSPMSITSTTVIQSELSHRYYFPSSRCSITEECRDSVIRSSKSEDSDVEVEEVLETETRHQQAAQPMDLTTKQISPSLQTPVVQRSVSTDILTPVSEPFLMQTIVQTMERLPPQGREWKPDADGQMLQAYLTERHVMDSKMKQQYRVGCGKSLEKIRTIEEHENYSKQLDFMSSRNMDLGSTPTVTYTDPSKLHQTMVETRIKCLPKQRITEDVKMEIREKIYQTNGAIEQRRSFDVECLRIDKDANNRGIGEGDNFDNRSSGVVVTRTNVDHRNLVIPKHVSSERSNFGGGWEFAGRSNPGLDRLSPKAFNAEANGRIVGVEQLTKNDVDRSSMFNAMKMMSEVELSRDSVNQDSRNVGHEINQTRENIIDARLQPSQSPRNQENGGTISRPPSREIRLQSQDYRVQPPSSSPSFNEQKSPSREFKLPCQEIHRPTSQEFKSPHQDQDRRVVGLETSATLPGVVVDVRHPTNDVRPPSRDARIVNEYKNEQRTIQNDLTRSGFDVVPSMIHENANKIHDVTRGQREARNSDRHEMKRHEMEIGKHNISESMKHSVARKMVVGGPGFRSPSPPGGCAKPQAEFLQPTGGSASNYVSYSVTEDGRSVCGICNKVFSKPSQLRLHINIHYFERPFRCESCAVSFRTKGHLTKHERSVSHHNKVSMTSTFGAATTSNPRPFKCTDCKIAFRIHGHLAKHLRSKMHIMKLECLGKLPFGTYAEMERSGVNLNDIDTTDCDNSLTSLQILAQKLYEKDPTKMGQWDAEMVPHQGASGGETSSDEGEPIPPQSMHQYPTPTINTDNDVSRSYHMPVIIPEDSKSINDSRNTNYRFHQQRPDYNNATDITTKLNEHVDDTRIDEFSHPYKCQICTVSVRTVNELQVHCFVEHNVESSGNSGITKIVDVRDNENTQKRISEEIRTVDDDPRRRHSDDT